MTNKIIKECKVCNHKETAPHCDFCNDLLTDLYLQLDQYDWVFNREDGIDNTKHFCSHACLKKYLNILGDEE